MTSPFTKLFAIMIAAFGVTSLFAVDPVAVWDGDFSDLTRDTLTINLNGNERAADNAYLQVTSDTTGGILIDDSASGGLNNYTMILKCSDLNLAAASAQVLFTSRSNTSTDRVGVNLPANNAACRGVWGNADWNDASVVATSVPSGYTSLIYNHQQGGGTFAYAIAGGAVQSIFNRQGLRASSDTYNGLAIGGLRGTRAGNTALEKAVGLKITGIAIFKANLSTTEMADYKFPSEGTTLNYTEDVAMSKILSDMGASLKADVTIADAKTITVDVAVPANKVVNFACADGTITLDVADGITYAAKSLDCAAVVKKGTGSITFTQDGAYTSCTIEDGSAAATALRGFGAYTDGAAMDDLSTITVGATATLDVGGSRNICYTIVSEGGTITNTGDDIGTGNRQTTKLVLNAPTTVTGNTWAVRANGGHPSRIETNGNTLTVRMNAGKNFYFYDCTVTGGGKVSIESGSLVPGGTCKINLADVEKTEGMVLVEWREGVTVPAMSGVTFEELGDFAWTIDETARQIKLVGNVAEVNGTAYPTLAQAIAAVAAGETITVLANCAGTVELDKDITLACDNTVIVSAVISGEGAITKTGAGTLTFAGANSFTGDVTVAEGVLKRGNAAAFGAATNTVAVTAGGTLDMNNVGGTAYPITIAGAGAEGHPFALTTTGSLAGFAKITLSDDATIGTTTSFSVNSTGKNMGLAGHTLKLVCGNGITGQNMNFDEGTVEIVSGRYTANQWNNNGPETTLVVDEGATYASSVDRDDRCTFKHIVNNGTVAMNGTYLLRATASYTGTGTVNNLWLDNGATNKLVATTGLTVSNRFVQGGALVVDLTDVELGEATEVTAIAAPEATAYKVLEVSVIGAEGLWGVSAAAGVLTVAKVAALATVDGEEFTSVAAAFAAADGKTVNVLYSTTEPIVVDGDVTVTCSDGVVFGGAITGTGSITILEGTVLTYSNAANIEPTVKGAGTLVIAEVSGSTIPTVAGLTAADWTGTVWLKGMTGKTGINLANLGNAESTIKISGVSGWMANAQTVTATVELANEGYAYGFNIHDGSSGDQYVSTFNTLAGNGKLLADGGSTAGFLIKDWSTFTGSVEASNKTITFGTVPKSGLNKIVVNAGATATIATNATWTANGGIQVDGTLVVEGTTTYDNFTPQTATHGTVGSPVSGAGEVVYLGALPADAATAMYTNEVAWTGTVTLKNFGELDDRTGIANSGHVRAALPGKDVVESWQNANSRIKFQGVKAWTPNNVTYAINLVLEDQVGENDEVIYAWHNDSGGSGNTTTFNKLSGAGTFYDNAECSHVMKFTDASDFTGAFTIQGKRVMLGGATTTPNAGGIRVSSTIAAAGQTWTAPGGVTLEADTTIVYTGAPLALATNTALTASAITVALADGITLDKATGLAKVLGWNAKPEDLTVVAKDLPKGWSVKAKADGLWLRYSSPLIFMIQ